MYQQIKNYIPYSEFIADTTTTICVRAKENTLEAYTQNLKTVKKTQQRALLFQKDFALYLKDISWETFNEFIYILEKVSMLQGTVTDQKAIRKRLELIVVSFKKFYFQNPIKFAQEKSLALYKTSEQRVMKKGLPLYIHLKAFLIVSQEMLSEFMAHRLNEMKMSYKNHKGSVVMFFSGNFNEEKLKQKLSEGIEGFKQITVKIVSKGLEVKVDRESLVENYDKFAIEFLNTVKELREKSQGNIGQVTKKSKNLYHEVVARIKAKQLEIKTEMKMKNNLGLEIAE